MRSRTPVDVVSVFTDRIMYESSVVDRFQKNFYISLPSEQDVIAQAGTIH